MEYTIIPKVFSATIIEGRHSGSRKFYAGKVTRYYIHGAVSKRRDQIMSAMMSHAYEQGETLLSLNKWRD